MLFSFFLCAYMRAKTVAEQPSSWPYREGCSFLVDDRRIPEGEKEKNSTELSRSYHAAIMGVNCSCGKSTSKLVQSAAASQRGRRRGRKTRGEEVSAKQYESPSGEQAGVGPKEDSLHESKRLAVFPLT